MCNRLGTAVSVNVEKSLTAEAKIMLGLDQQHASVADLIAVMLIRCMDKSEELQYELRRVAEKIKIYKKCSLVEYVTKHRALRKDIINVGCAETILDVDEKVTMLFILSGLKDDPH